MKNRVLIGLAAAGIIGGATYGFAATLTPTSDNLGAGSDGVASCDSAIDVSYTSTFKAATGRYEVTSVEIGNVEAACNGQAIQVDLTGPEASTASVSHLATTVALTSGGQSLDVPDVDAANVTGVAVVIDG